MIITLIFLHNFCNTSTGYFWVFFPNGDICFEFWISDVTNTDFQSRTEPARRIYIQISTNLNIYILCSLLSEEHDIVGNLFFVWLFNNHDFNNKIDPAGHTLTSLSIEFERHRSTKF